MANYLPPTENLPTFNPEVFSQNDEPLTIEEGTKYFITYPTSQPSVNLQQTTINGVLTANKNINLTGTTDLDRSISSTYYRLLDTFNPPISLGKLYAVSQDVILDCDGDESSFTINCKDGGGTKIYVFGVNSTEVNSNLNLRITGGSNLIMPAGTGIINQPFTTGNTSIKNIFKLSHFIFNSNISNGTPTAFEFFDGVNGKGLFIMPNSDNGSLSDTNRRNDCVLSSRAPQNNNAITISNWNTNMRLGLRVFTTDISNCGLTLQCGQHSTGDWAEFKMTYNRDTLTTTTTFNDVINFNPASPAIPSTKRALIGLGTLSFTDNLNGGSTGTTTSTIYTDSTLVNSLNGMYYQCNINGGFHQFSARDGAGNLSTPIYYGAAITSVSNTFIIRNSTTPSNRFDISVDGSQVTSIRARSTTASTSATININCDSVNVGGTTSNNAVLTIAPTYVETKRPIQFNYSTTPSVSSQLGFFNSVNIIGSAYSTQTAPNSMGEIILSSGTWKIEANFSFTSSGNHTYSVFSYALSSSSTAFPTALPYTIAYIQEPGLNINTTTATRQVNLTLQLTSNTSIFLLERVTFTGGGTTNISVNYGITRIG